MESRRWLLGIASVVLLCSACSEHRRVTGGRMPPSPSSGTSGAMNANAGDTEVGYASWYGVPYHGRQAASGEVYDQNKLTAAHLTLPFGTQTRVTNLENNRSVVVRINDRGPFVEGRMIDLSRAAASAIGVLGPGSALVRLQILSVPHQPALDQYAVQVGAFRDRSTAERLRDRLIRRYGNAFIQNYDSGNGLLYRVRVGPKPSFSQASELASELKHESLRGFVVRVEN